MPSADVFQKSLLPLGAVQLGRLVLNTKSPQQDFLDPLTGEPPEFIVKPQHSFEEIRASAKAFKLRARLTQLLSTSYGKEYSDLIDLTAKNAFTYMLCNSKSWFTKACALSEIRQWLEKAIEDGSDVYLVVGYHTLVDAQLSEWVASTNTISGGVSIPIDTMAGSGLPRMAGMGLDSRVDSTKGTSNGYKRKFHAPGEQIYAVQYRKILFKWYSSRTIEKGFLEPDNRWRIYWGRGQDDGDDDVVEVDFGDEIELEGSEESYISEDGECEFII